MTLPELPWEGRCLCGQIRFRMTARPVVTMACHCTGCQRLTSGPYSLSAVVMRDAFELVEGTPVVGALHGESRHEYCPHCMSWMFTHPAGLDAFVNVRTTMLDVAQSLPPYIETWTDERLPWATTGAVHAYDQVPPPEDYEQLMAGYAAWTP